MEPFLCAYTSITAHILIPNFYNRAGASYDDCVRPDCLLFLFGLPLLFPFFKFPLPLYALVESENVGQDAAGDSLNLVLGNIGVVDGFPSLAQVVSSVSKITKARPSVLSCTLQIAF